MIQVEKLHLALNGVSILKGVDLKAQPGKMVGLIGPNGSGKSTLLRAMMKLYDFTEGCIHLKDKEIRQYSLKELSRVVGYLPQRGEVHWPLTVENIVRLGRIPHKNMWEGYNDHDASLINAALEEVGIEELRTRSMLHLSGGEKTLALLARVLVSQPEYLLVDEPVAGLDPKHQLRIMSRLHREAQKGKTVMVVLHDLTLAARYCDELHLMCDGKIMASGNCRDVLSQENLMRAYGITAKQGEGDDYFVIPWEVKG